MSKSDNTIEKTYNLNKDVIESLEREAEERGVPVEEHMEDVFGSGFYVMYEDVEESVVKIKYTEPWSQKDTKVEPADKGEETLSTLKTFRRLRDDFPPVTAGVEFSKAFTSGSGFETVIDDSTNEDQKDKREVINKLNRSIYQDTYTVGLDAILDILLDEVFTVGAGACEIVYESAREPNSLNFENWATKVDDPEKGYPEYKSRVLEDDDWKRLGGIVQLKIVDDAVRRLKPYRDPDTYKVEYWTVDEEEIHAYNNNPANRDKPKAVPKLLPWQVLWLSWGRRGSNLKGVSLIRPAAKTSLLLEKILAAVGLSFQKWSDKKYFFILGSDKLGRSWAKPKVREFLLRVKKMTMEGGTAIPVPAGFDVKEIGGEVFEGGEIISNLISLICGSMRYPRTFLEQGKTQEGDKAWLAWIVTYASHQKALRRAIEHQLWSRHLYCLHGTTMRKSVQGLAIEKQPRVPVYVPKMSWKSEGKWHVQTKIEELTRILNVANPVGGELKLEVEGELATTLGLSDLNFENARKVLQQRQKLELIDGEVDLLKGTMLKESLEKAMEDKAHLEMIPQIQGLKEEEPEPPPEPKRPPPVPLERLAGGVSRTAKVTGEEDKKGVAKPLGGTRKPKPKPAGVQETGTVNETEPMIEFDTYEGMFDAVLRFRENRDRSAVYMKMIEVLDNMDSDVDGGEE